MLNLTQLCMIFHCWTKVLKNKIKSSKLIKKLVKKPHCSHRKKYLHQNSRMFKIDWRCLIIYRYLPYLDRNIASYGNVWRRDLYRESRNYFYKILAEKKTTKFTSTPLGWLIEKEIWVGFDIHETSLSRLNASLEPCTCTLCLLSADR